MMPCRIPFPHGHSESMHTTRETRPGRRQTFNKCPQLPVAMVQLSATTHGGFTMITQMAGCCPTDDDYDE